MDWWVGFPGRSPGLVLWRSFVAGESGAYVSAPFQGFDGLVGRFPRALPWAGVVPPLWGWGNPARLAAAPMR